MKSKILRLINKVLLGYQGANFEDGKKPKGTLGNWKFFC